MVQDLDGLSDSYNDCLTLSQIKRSRIDLARRYVFLCPTSLAKHFEALPLAAKDAALLVFRCSRNVVFLDPPCVRRERADAKVQTGLSPARRPSASRSNVSSMRKALYKTDFTPEFLSWLQTKEKEGCVFWLKPEKDLLKLSAFFQEKIDPMVELPYRPLLLDPAWWRIKFDRTSARYLGSPAPIIALVSDRSREGVSARDQPLDIEALQELIFQSNPTLEPITMWPHAPSMRFLPRPGAIPKAGLGREARFKGFIDQQFDREGMAPRSLTKSEQVRVASWPKVPQVRLDNLYHSWEVDAAMSGRRQHFALHGAATMSPRPNTGR